MSFLSDLTVLPSDSSNVGLGANDLQAFKTRVATRFGTWFYYPGTGGASFDSAGIPKPGASKVFVGAASASSYTETYPNQNKLYWDTSSNALLLYSETTLGSGNTRVQQVGGNTLTEHSLASSNVAWVTISHSTLLDATMPASLDMQYSIYSATGSALFEFEDGAPIVQVAFSDPDLYGAVSAATETGFSANLSYSGTTVDTTMYWSASGYVSLGSE